MATPGWTRRFIRQQYVLDVAIVVPDSGYTFIFILIILLIIYSCDDYNGDNDDVVMNIYIVESLMLLMNAVFGGSVDLYTMDHRGTGRSNRLVCEASQVETSGSPSKAAVSDEEFSHCIQDINIELGNVTPPNQSMSSFFERAHCICIYIYTYIHICIYVYTYMSSFGPPKYVYIVSGLDETKIAH